MSNSSFEIKCTSSCSDAEVQHAIDMLVTDLNNLGNAEVNTMYCHDLQTESLNHLGTESSDGMLSAFNIMATDVPNQTCNLISGGIVCISYMMDIVSDLVNLMNIANEDFMACVDAVDPSKSASSQYWNGTGILQDGCNIPDELVGFHDAISVFSCDTFDVTVNGQTYHNVKLLPASDGSSLGLLCDPKYWPAGKSPMDEHSGNLITTSVDSIIDMFNGAWNADGSCNYAQMWNDIVNWVVPTVDSTTGIASTGDEVDQMTKLISETLDELQTNTQELQNELNTAVSEMQDFQGWWKDQLDYLSTMGMACVNGQVQ